MIHILEHLAVGNVVDAEEGAPYEAVAFLDLHVPNTRVLVVCDGGVGRGLSVVVSYLCAAR